LWNKFSIIHLKLNLKSVLCRAYAVANATFPMKNVVNDSVITCRQLKQLNRVFEMSMLLNIAIEKTDKSDVRHDIPNVRNTRTGISGIQSVVLEVRNRLARP
jgi:hypothetical protein